MKTTKIIFALFIFCTLFLTSCTDNSAEDEVLYTTQDIQTTDGDGSPIDKDKTGG